MVVQFSRILRHAANTAGSGNLVFSLMTPHTTLVSKKVVKQATLPGSEGYFTVTKGHSAMLSNLKPGVVSVVCGDTGEVAKYFLSSGFFKISSVDGDSVAEVSAVEAVPVDQIDKDRATQVLQELLAEAQGSTDPWIKAKAVLGQDLCAAIIKTV
ncbi:ATP synthase, Delta/Epsilon chain, beta-sandwich domain containing protein, putative [Babesia bigemina]|uniref:ATP synthase, Delta/Epsilon chain, beta-sandwich domain containing protein, putative n=1 Tax=Babesia bigemina TaxID=5866 RepID=A0A061D9D3_BABBI|nr:ATP synthase, Delta/Epsilon chain, beta-sandwich domain containing protein, putative [Babesia bigemina]CDR97158.1 ATP synthase, Delta/Epsilon chain, beta-sandwich domain containing protein, putative [Babesia bigemina]|eukprot:XP_012769344.1 ATP synthase, Delta/Epsilon chain, beta-sandwich domain containing protein, putative [Babesia bigemina]